MRCLIKGTPGVISPFAMSATITSRECLTHSAWPHSPETAGYPTDLEQRSIVIELQRRLPGELLDVLRDDRADDLHNLARMCARWSDDYADDISGIEPDMGSLINRIADNWLDPDYRREIDN